MREKTEVSANQDGFASIVIALVIVIVLSLITVGFAQLARQEQQDALTKQLASQAYYAAESGVNDVVNKIPALQTLRDADPSKIDPNKCLDLPAILPNSSINAQTDVSYSCVLLDLDPSSIEYSNISDRSSREVTFSTVGGTGTLGSLKVSWGSANSGKTPRTGPNYDFAPQASWNSPGVLQLSISKLGSSGTYTRAALSANTFYVYLYPSSDTSKPNTVTFQTDPNAQAPIVSGHCSGTSGYTCNAQISGINGVANETYLIRVLNYYDTTNLSINSAKDTAGTPIEFKNGQAEVDVTGKAKNVLKRIHVRVPIKPSSPTPDFAIESQSTCKRFAGWPTTAYAPAPLTTWDTASTSCQLSP